jgi:hypothetical protein
VAAERVIAAMVEKDQVTGRLMIKTTNGPEQFDRTAHAQTHRTIFESRAKDGTDVTCPECKLWTTIRVKQHVYLEHDSVTGEDLVPWAPR